MYRYAWHCGLKTTYYLRTIAATSVEKSSLSSKKRNVTLSSEIKACSIDNPECESCQ
jgi:ribonucleoside-diphosphate reductase alpha chain